MRKQLLKCALCYISVSCNGGESQLTGALKYGLILDTLNTTNAMPCQTSPLLEVIKGEVFSQCLVSFHPSIRVLSWSLDYRYVGKCSTVCISHCIMRNEDTGWAINSVCHLKLIGMICRYCGYACVMLTALSVVQAFRNKLTLNAWIPRFLNTSVPTLSYKPI